MSRVDCVSDLVTRARRYRLSQGEQARLDEHLAVCAGCRRDQQVGADFDAVAGLRAGDERLIAALAGKAFERLDRQQRPWRRRWLPVAAASVCLLITAGAGAGVLWHLRTPATSSVVSRSETFPRAAPSADHANAPPEVAQEPAPPAPASRIASGSSVAAWAPRPKPRVHGSAPVPHPAPTAADSLAETASALFASANGARRRGDAAAAMAIYDELQRRHPTSDEARVSRVSAGRLLLEGEAWTDALAQLDRYLIASPDGQLAQEALFGKARALRALDRRDEERATLDQLVRRFPSSVYVVPARRRIEELQ